MLYNSKRDVEGESCFAASRSAAAAAAAAFAAFTLASTAGARGRGAKDGGCRERLVGACGDA